MRRLSVSTSPFVEIVTGHLSRQARQLQCVLDEIERTNSYESDYVTINLKMAESEIRRLRKFIECLDPK